MINCLEALLPITIMNLIGNSEFSYLNKSHLSPYVAHTFGHVIHHIHVRVKFQETYPIRIFPPHFVQINQ